MQPHSAKYAAFAAECAVEPGLWSQGCGARAVESEPKTFRWWSPSLKLRFRSHSLWGKQVAQIIQWF